MESTTPAAEGEGLRAPAGGAELEGPAETAGLAGTAGMSSVAIPVACGEGESSPAAVAGLGAMVSLPGTQSERTQEVVSELRRERGCSGAAAAAKAAAPDP